MLTNRVRTPKLLAGVASLAMAMCFFSPAAQADVQVLFNDLTDTVNILTTQNGNTLEVRPVGENGGEQGYYMFWGGILPADVNVAYNFFEADGTLSDTITLTGAQGSQVFNFNFQSDIEGTLLNPIPGGINVLETGGIQPVLTWAQDALGQCGGADCTAPLGQVTIAVVSDVPEPISLILFATGLAGLGFGRRRSSK